MECTDRRDLQRLARYIKDKDIKKEITHTYTHTNVYTYINVHTHIFLLDLGKS